MLLSAAIDKKVMGSKELFSGLLINIEANEKVAIIGRNGVGKTTLFSMLSDVDIDFEGEVTKKRGARIVTTAQEHHNIGEQTVLDYVLSQLPDYARLKHIIETYPDTMGDDLKKIETYSNALEHFSQLGYYMIDTDILLSLDAYQLSEDKALAPMKQLSGGQKRFVELVRVEHSDADLALIDEPTNHMDYVAKQAFIDWFRSVKHSVVVISHDRDVLQEVDRIIEIKDGQAQVFKGNYKAYLKQNAERTATSMHSYEVTQRQIVNLKKRIEYAKSKKASWGGTADKKNPFVVMEVKARKEMGKLLDIEKPSFWIDQESANNLKKSATDNYEKYKAKNIVIRTNKQNEHTRELLNIEDLALSYTDSPLFRPVSFRLEHGQRLQLIGRNGAGKTTLVRAIIDAVNSKRAATWRAGSIFTDSKLRLSVYEQEANAELLDMPLNEAIEHIYRSQHLAITDEKVMQIMSDYLFNPYEDAGLTVADLSGGQKARLQIIKMLANNPNLLILDEPTNHLDLPSIEELENTLKTHTGALLYISHDSYFANNIGGENITLQKPNA